MKPVDFDYAAPATPAEAVALLRAHGPDAKILAGGQSLMPLLNMRLARPQFVIDLRRVRELDYIADAGDSIRIGALTSHRTVGRSTLVKERLPLLNAAVGWIGHTQIRNRGTLGGSMVHADPAAELPLVATALDAAFVVLGVEGDRTVPAAEFFTGLFSTAVEPDELLTAVEFPVWEGKSGWSFQEVARRHGDFALVAAVAQLQLAADGRFSRVALALGGVGLVPVRLAAVAATLVGQPTTAAAVAAAARAASAAIEPDGDLHASAEYRREVAGTLVQRALTAAIERAGGTNLG